MKNAWLNTYGLSGNALKMIAAFSMLADHIGFVLFPDAILLRVIGRIAFPIFAFMIAEGCAYTKHKWRYFLTVFLLGIACQTVYFLYAKEFYIGILLVFSLSILMVYALDYFKSTLFDADGSFIKQCLAFTPLLVTVIAVYFINKTVECDYGFWGCMAPVFASVFRKPSSCNATRFEKWDHTVTHVCMLAIPLIMMSLLYRGIRPFALLAIPLLLLYSGKRGKHNMKYFFYVFYPAHLIALEAIAFLCRR